MENVKQAFVVGKLGSNTCNDRLLYMIPNSFLTITTLLHEINCRLFICDILQISCVMQTEGTCPDML